MVYVEAAFATEDDAWITGERCAAVSAELLEETDILVVLAPFVHQREP